MLSQETLSHEEWFANIVETFTDLYFHLKGRGVKWSKDKNFALMINSEITDETFPYELASEVECRTDNGQGTTLVSISFRIVGSIPIWKRLEMDREEDADKVIDILCKLPKNVQMKISNAVEENWEKNRYGYAKSIADTEERGWYLNQPTLKRRTIIVSKLLASLKGEQASGR